MSSGFCESSRSAHNLHPHHTTRFDTTSGSRDDTCDSTHYQSWMLSIQCSHLILHHIHGLKCATGVKGGSTIAPGLWSGGHSRPYRRVDGLDSHGFVIVGKDGDHGFLRLRNRASPGTEPCARGDRAASSWRYNEYAFRDERHQIKNWTLSPGHHLPSRKRRRSMKGGFSDPAKPLGADGQWKRFDDCSARNAWVKGVWACFCDAGPDDHLLPFLLLLPSLKNLSPKTVKPSVQSQVCLAPTQRRRKNKKRDHRVLF